MMKRYFLEISYNGTHYAGSQKQHNAITVQEVLNQKLQILLKHEVETVFSSRTDAGVHCKQQFIHVDTPNPIEDYGKFRYALNSLLPADIAINRIFEVDFRAHARFSAIRRTYQYHICPYKNPFSLQSSWQFFPKLCLESMNKASQFLLGEHDFRTFCKVRTHTSHFLCNITNAKWEQNEEEIIFTITSNRFLRGMVRLIVGTLVDVGRNKISVEDFQKIITSRDVKKSSGAAPPQGLFLCLVEYPPQIFERN
ncbi:MAG: tRNA pseudouridine(38-40) synthase TruA [Cytophagales bacterium]|nr:tRNA pseudouridine(38-40) synthase TruA [Cytophagales bacterium]MDW8385036.1 tRNA pseudouridine(38-40) synthase TruA [Flammeovirgaceae bacterium]